MTKDEAADVLEAIEEFYPKFEMTKIKARVILPQLMRMDYEGVMDKLSKHVATHAFAPTIAQIAAYPVVPNAHLEELDKWRKEASMVSDETKRNFQVALQNLIRKCAND